MYKIQIGRYGSDWEDYDVSIASSELGEISALSFWIDKAHYVDDYNGKYVVRIVDETGKIYYEKHAPYEGTRINIYDTETDWLEEVRQNYGIDVGTWQMMINKWLKSWELPF